MRREVFRHKWMMLWESDDGSPFITMQPSDAGTMIVPVTETIFFRQPPRGVTLDGVMPAVTHVPFR